MFFEKVEPFPPDAVSCIYETKKYDRRRNGFERGDYCLDSIHCPPVRVTRAVWNADSGSIHEVNGPTLPGKEIHQDWLIVSTRYCSKSPSISH